MGSRRAMAGRSFADSVAQVFFLLPGSRKVTTSGDTERRSATGRRTEGASPLSSCREREPCTNTLLDKGSLSRLGAGGWERVGVRVRAAEPRGGRDRRRPARAPGGIWSRGCSFAPCRRGAAEPHREQVDVDSSTGGTMPFTIDQIREALSRHQPQLSEREPECSEAAVALVLAGRGEELSLCAIRRAEHPLDPWSGHMALPGGRASPEDGGPRAVAERETFEEVGIALGEPHWI